MTRVIGLAALVILFLPAAARAQADAALARVFGASAEVASEFRPASHTADLDGDGVRDLLVVARIRGRVPAGVRVLNPWRSGPPAAARGLALVILHGTRGGWTRPHLFTDRDFFATPIWSGPRGVSVVRRGGRPAVVIPTEAGIDTYLRWTGRAYRLEVPAEAP